jgi:hypothetical protein
LAVTTIQRAYAVFSSGRGINGKLGQLKLAADIFTSEHVWAVTFDAGGGLEGVKMSNHHAAVHDSFRRQLAAGRALRQLWTVFGRCGRKVSQITKSLAYFATQRTS